MCVLFDNVVQDYGYRWALFYLNRPSLALVIAAQYAFLDDKKTIGVDITQRLFLKLTDTIRQGSQNAWTSTICKIEVRHSRFYLYF